MESFFVYLSALGFYNLQNLPECIVLCVCVLAEDENGFATENFSPKSTNIP